VFVPGSQYNPIIQVTDALHIAFNPAPNGDIKLNNGKFGGGGGDVLPWHTKEELQEPMVQSSAHALGKPLKSISEQDGATHLPLTQVYPLRSEGK